MRPSVKERARAFVAKARPAIAGQNGHDATFAVACGLVVGFGLSDEDAWDLINQYNVTSCQPAWSEKDLHRKLDQARKQAERNPSEVGKLAEQDSATYTGPRLPANNAPARPAAPKAVTGQPGRVEPRRTPRTPLFNVRRAGEGAEPRTSRTVRTLPADSFLPSTLTPHPSNNIESKKEVSEVSKPAVTKSATAAPTTKPKAVPQEPSDVTTIMSNGDVFQTRWRQKERYLGNLNDPRKTRA